MEAFQRIFPQILEASEAHRTRGRPGQPAIWGGRGFIARIGRRGIGGEDLKLGRGTQKTHAAVRSGHSSATVRDYADSKCNFTYPGSWIRPIADTCGLPWVHTTNG